MKNIPDNHFEYKFKAKDGIDLYGQAWKSHQELNAIFCLVHGIGEHSGRYKEMVAALNESGFSVIAFDLRGHGKSGGKRGHTPSYEMLLDDVEVFLDQARKYFPKKKIVLFGHSLGGNIVLNYVLQCKPDISGVIASAPALRIPPLPFYRKFFAAIGNVLFPEAQHHIKMDLGNASHNVEAVKSMRGDNLMHGKCSARLYMGFYKAGLWAIANADKLEIPALVMHGSEDHLTLPEGSKEFARNAKEAKAPCELKIWEGLFHNLQDEPEKNEIFEYMEVWIAKIL